MLTNQHCEQGLLFVLMSLRGCRAQLSWLVSVDEGRPAAGLGGVLHPASDGQTFLFY